MMRSTGLLYTSSSPDLKQAGSRFKLWLRGYPAWGHKHFSDDGTFFAVEKM